MHGVRLEQVPEFKYLGWGLDESGADAAENHRKVPSRKIVAVAIN